MLILGIICLVVGYFLGIGVLETIGWILVVVGAILLVMSGVGRPIGGRHWY